jgi:hypothetical protein
VTADITNTSIANTFTENDISDNDGSGVGIYNEMYADADAYSGFTVTGSLLSSVTNSDITNTFTGNTINRNDDYGVCIYSYLEAWADNSDSIGGDLDVSVDGSSITDTFSGNDISDNGYYDGVYIYNYMEASYSDWGFVSGTIDASITGSSISDTFTNNTVTSNDGSSGIYLDYYTYAVDIEDVAVDLFMEGNQVVGNDENGVYIYYSGSGTFTGDLGGGTLGSLGNNSFYGNDVSALGYYDLYNDTVVEIKAENNWWGSAYEVDFNIYGLVDYDPCRLRPLAHCCTLGYKNNKTNQAPG